MAQLRVISMKPKATLIEEIEDWNIYRPEILSLIPKAEKLADITRKEKTNSKETIELAESILDIVVFFQERGYLNRFKSNDGTWKSHASDMLKNG